MTVIQNNLLVTGDEGYNNSRSLRFRSSASAYLSKTLGAGGTNTKHATSFWMKRGTISTAAYFVLYGAYIDVNNYIYIWMTASDKIGVYWNSSGVAVLNMQSTMVLRDPSAWYHVYFTQDTTQATASNRFRMWINGAEITSWSTNTNTTTQNVGTPFGGNNVHNIGRDPSTSSNYFDGYITEFNDVWQPSSMPSVSEFGEFDLTTGVWKPKKYSGTYGTNGFYLNFSDNSSNTATTIGKDYSGNGNNWTPNNISVTAGATYDSMTDVPTLTSATAANYAVLNPLIAGTTTLTNGNLTGSGVSSFYSTIQASSGKYYVEYIIGATSDAFIGVNNGAILATGYRQDGTRYNGTTWVSYGSSYAAGDVIGMAFNLDSSTVEYLKNGTSQGSVSSISYGAYNSVQMYAGGSNFVQANFGQRPFSYTPPTGFVALNTFNLPEPSIKAGNKHFDATLYTGNGSTQTITNSGSMQPDLVWIKNRSSVAQDHTLVDSVRGIYRTIQSDTTGAESLETGFTVTAFNSNGFQVTDDSAGSYSVNGSVGGIFSGASAHVAWQWKAGGSAVSNTAGSITSQVSANTSAGFSVVTWTNNNTANQSIGHGLGVAPKMIITKDRDNGTFNWATWFTGFTKDEYLLLNTTGAKASFNTLWFQTPDSSKFYIGSTATGVNYGADRMVAYCFSEVAGYSKFGSYTGNGTGGDGPFIYLGFKPRYILIKRTDSTSNWTMLDSARDVYNPEQRVVWSNLSDVEATATQADFLANGFKLRAGAGGANNISGGTYIYAAFAENPMKFSLAR